ncbi:MAG: tRNA pseudouridine(13) synthase TruD [Pseudomonas sp.]
MSEALPRAFGMSVLAARIRTRPEDFRVDEIDAFAPHGEGEHLLLTLRKRGLNTAEVARRLARWAGIGEVGIGYAGLKDRHAITTQRFSVHLPRRVAPPLEALQDEDLQVLHSVWHNRKLPRGALAGNRFTLLLRQVEGDPAQIEARLAQIAARGIPNWFGEQRFGRGGGNVGQALAMFAGARVRREQRSILLSAARSELFNRVLTRRVGQGSWDSALEGEVWMLAGSRSVFGPEPWNDALAQRLAAFDIHPTGPLWGEGELRSSAACLQDELAALDDEVSLRLRQGLEQAGLKQERRALRLQVADLTWTWCEMDVLELTFSLPPGSYATALLHELGEVAERA